MEACNLRQWSVNCVQNSYDIYALENCTETFKARQLDSAKKYDETILDPDDNPHKVSDDWLSVSNKMTNCNNRAYDFYDLKQCVLTGVQEFRDLVCYRGYSL